METLDLALSGFFLMKKYLLLYQIFLPGPWLVMTTGSCNNDAEKTGKKLTHVVAGSTDLRDAQNLNQVSVGMWGISGEGREAYIVSGVLHDRSFLRGMVECVEGDLQCCQMV
jgi:hypothetical protein